MRNKLKTILFTAGILLLTPSCASYKNVTLGGCFPEDKDNSEEIIIKKSDTNHIKNNYFFNDDLINIPGFLNNRKNLPYTIKSYKNPITEDSEIKIERKFMKF